MTTSTATTPAMMPMVLPDGDAGGTAASAGAAAGAIAGRDIVAPADARLGEPPAAGRAMVDEADGEACVVAPTTGFDPVAEAPKAGRDPVAEAPTAGRDPVAPGKDVINRCGDLRRRFKRHSRHLLDAFGSFR